ncbi:hypothetical protein BCSJ1_14895 [Bacillus cereus SJ1]|nr:hypothetical protein BCSJ1_14895 [Bacillus cereus SJ1]
MFKLKNVLAPPKRSPSKLKKTNLDMKTTIIMPLLLATIGFFTTTQVYQAGT